MVSNMVLFNHNVYIQIYNADIPYLRMLSRRMQLGGQSFLWGSVVSTYAYTTGYFFQEAT